MSGMRVDNVTTEQPHVDRLDDVRNLQITYSRLKPGEGICFVEHAGGRVKVYEVDRFLIEHVLEHLEHPDA